MNSCVCRNVKYLKLLRREALLVANLNDWVAQRVDKLIDKYIESLGMVSYTFNTEYLSLYFRVSE